MKKKYKAQIDQNGGEYTGWITFYADTVVRKDERTLIVDGYEMEFDETVFEPEEYK